MPKKILRRQDLEDLERRHGIRLFLLPAEAVAAVRAKDRRAGGLTYGWQTVDHPDVTGVVLKNVRRFLRHDLGQHLEALFWDFASLPQKPRSPAEDAFFKLALPVMGDAYASPRELKKVHGPSAMRADRKSVRMNLVQPSPSLAHRKSGSLPE